MPVGSRVRGPSGRPRIRRPSKPARSSRYQLASCLGRQDRVTSGSVRYHPGGDIMKPFRPALIGLMVLALAAEGPAAPLPKSGSGDGLVDQFDGKLTLDWKVIRPDKDHVSLKKVPGAL